MNRPWQIMLKFLPISLSHFSPILPFILPIFLFNAPIFLKHANCQTHGYLVSTIFACDNDMCTVCNNLMLILEISDGSILID